MRTFSAGLKALRRTPFALVPLSATGVVAALLMLLGVLPSTGASAPAVAVFPLDVFFDMRQTVTDATGWPVAVSLVLVSVVLRASAFGATIVLAEGGAGTRADALRVVGRVARLAAMSALAFLPSIVFLFAGTAARYAPFMWIGAAFGFLAAVLFGRRALQLDAGSGPLPTKDVPEIMSFLAYAYLVTVMAAAMTALGRIAPILAALLLVCTAPVHAIFVLGWREHARNGTYPGGGALSVAATAVVLALLFGGTVYDRFIRSAAPVGRAPQEGRLLMLVGVDATATKGALAEIDPRELGFRESRVSVLSYVSDGPHSALDTHRDLNDVALAVAPQIEQAEPPRYLVGHSQAGLILDRLIVRGLATPDRSVVFAPPPPYPATVRVPAPGAPGRGRVGADLANGLASLLRGIGLPGFDVDAAASPARAEQVVAPRAPFPRLSVWAWGDAVWLDGDWRRPGEINLVALTDHVGVANNSRAIAAAAAHLRGREIAGDTASWRSALVTLLRYAFEPWRPA